MATIKIFKIGLLLAAAQFLLCFSCNKDKTIPCGLTFTYSFEATAEWSPQKEVYNIGDTLFINSVIPKTLIDKVSNTSVDFSNSVGIGGDIGIFYVDTITHQVIPAKDSFQFYSLTGSFVERPINKDHGINTSYRESSANYQFEGGVICKKKGIYSLGVADLISMGIKGKNCTKAGFGITVTNSNKNLALYESILGIKLDSDGQKRIYCFRVQ